MYQLDPNTDLSFLLGRTLLDTTSDEHGLVMRLSEQAEIGIQSSIELNGEAVDFEAVTRLVGESIFGATLAEGSAMNLYFSEGSHLFVSNDADDYESYTVSAPGKYLVV